MSKKKVDTRFRPDSKAIICEELVEFVCQYMARGYKKWSLKKIIEDELGTPMCIKTFETLRKQAREMLKDTLLSPEEHKINAIELVYQTIQDPSTPPSSRLRAAELLLQVSATVTSEENAKRVDNIRKILAEIDGSFSEEGEQESEDDTDASVD